MNAESENLSASRAGLIAIVGRANVGKSSLINALVGEKVSIVSHVAQTTRTMIRAILTEPRGQLVFVDTPGMHRAVGDLGRVMNQTARSAVEGVDVVMLVLDVNEPPREEDEGWFRRLVTLDAPCVMVLNKVDEGEKYTEVYKKLWAETATAKGSTKQAVWLKASAVLQQGISELIDRLFAVVPQGPLLFPEDVLTDYPRKLIMADMIREKLFLELRDELPHAIAVWIETIDESENDWKIEAVIYVNKSSQKGIVIGEKGRLLRKVKRSAERELAEIYEHPVQLSLWVKVEKNWSRNFWLLKKFGYVA